jgi:hypothetical protein
LDEKFWVWESIEESIRGEVDTISADDFNHVFHAFAVNFKGSRELIDNFETRATRDHAQIFPDQKHKKEHSPHKEAKHH